MEWLYRENVRQSGSASLSLSCSLRPSGRPALPASAISAGADPHSLTRLRSFGGDKSVNISSPPLESRCSSTLLLACAPITELVHPDGQTRQLRTREPVSVPVRPSRRSRLDAQRTLLRNRLQLAPRTGDVVPVLRAKQCEVGSGTRRKSFATCWTRDTRLRPELRSKLCLLLPHVQGVSVSSFREVSGEERE